MTCGIYSIETRKGQIYIGSSKKIEWRFICHESALRCSKHNNQKFQNSYNKNGKKITKKILIICSEKDLLLYEQIAFAALKPKLNLSLIAGKVEFTPEILAKAQAWKDDPIKGPEAFAKISSSNKGKTKSDEEKARMSAIRKGRPAWNKGILFTEEHKAKLRANSQKGKKISPEAAATRAAARFGKPGPNAGRIFSAESREKMKQSQLKRWRKFKNESYIN